MEGSLQINQETIGKRDGIGLWQTDSINILTEQEAEFIVIEVPVNQ